MRLGVAAAVAALGVSAAEAAEGPQTPEEAVGYVFCLVKDDKPEAGMSTMLTPGLAELIQKAVDRNAAIAQAEPDEKPPLGDGIPFQSYPDLAPKCEIGDVTGVGPGAVVEIRHLFPDAPDASFVDRLVLGSGWNDGKLGIDDVLYGESGDNGSLREVLADILR